MAVGFRSAASVAATGSQTSLVVPVPAGVQNGDILLMAVYLTASSGTITDPAGWTSIASNVIASSSASSRASLWWRRAASEPASYTVTTGNGRSSGVMIALTGALAAGSPVDVSGNAVAATASLSAVAPTVTATAAGLLVTTVGGRLAPNGAAATWAPAASATEHVEVSSAVAATSNSSAEMASEQVGAGATGTRTATASVVTAVDWIAFSVVVKPAAGGGAIALVGTDADGSSTADAGPLSRARLLVGTGADGTSTADGVLSKQGASKPLVGTGADGSSTADAVLRRGLALVGTGADGSSTADAVLAVAHQVALVGSFADGSSTADGVLSGGRVIGGTITRLPIDGTELDIYAHPPGFARWGLSAWPAVGDPDTPHWSSPTWVETTCLITSAKWAWGANRSLGVLSVAAGGPFLATTYDPDRQLDPSNGASPFVGSVSPGALVRVRYLSTVLAWATLDEIGYSLQAEEGRLQGFDAVGALLNAEVAPIASPPLTLRAFARAYLALTPWAATFSVEPDPPEGDLAIGSDVTAPTDLVGCWQMIQLACQDALAFGWIAPDLVLRFRSHGEPVDNGLTLGFDGIPTGELITQTNRDGIVNRVVALDTTGPPLTVDGAESQARFGIAALDRTTRKVPGAQAWADRVLADRAFASLEYYPSAIIPSTQAQLLALAAMGGIDVVRIRLDVPEPDVSVDVRSVGLQLEASPDGWVGIVVGYVSSAEWTNAIEPPPPEPTPPPATTTIQRSFTSTKAARVSKTDTGAKYGAGAQDNIPVGAHSGWQDRMLVQFDIDWSSVVELVSATLRLRTSSQVYTGFGSNPRVRVQRATESWSEGSATTPGSGNAVVWPGPAATATGERTAYISGNEGVQEDIDVTAIARAWAPAAAGGSGQTNRGLRISAYTETNTAHTTEFRSDDYGTAGHRPQLIITVKVPT